MLFDHIFGGDDDDESDAENMVSHLQEAQHLERDGDEARGVHVEPVHDHRVDAREVEERRRALDEARARAPGDRAPRARGRARGRHSNYASNYACNPRQLQRVRCSACSRLQC